MQYPAYADIIRLNEPFEPAPSSEATDPFDAALSALVDEIDFRISKPALMTPFEKRQLLQHALTIRPAGRPNSDLFAATDALLQRERADKTITRAQDLPRLPGPYPAASKVSIWDGDISTLEVDAIVNAANAQMEGCFQPFHACIDNVIHNAAGPQLRDDCHAIMQAQGHLEATGDAKITRAYNLPSDFVLHTVGPIIPHGTKPEPQDARALASCYTNCLDLAASMEIKCVAFCGISTGVFGYPPEQAARVALHTVSEWLDANTSPVAHVVFNTFGAAATQIYVNATQNWTLNEHA